MRDVRTLEPARSLLVGLLLRHRGGASPAWRGAAPDCGMRTLVPVAASRAHTCSAYLRADSECRNDSTIRPCTGAAQPALRKRKESSVRVQRCTYSSHAGVSHQLLLSPQQSMLKLSMRTPTQRRAPRRRLGCCAHMCTAPSASYFGLCEPSMQLTPAVHITRINISDNGTVHLM